MLEMQSMKDYFQIQLTTLPRKLKVGIQTTTHAQSIAKMGLGVQVSDGTATSAIQGYIEQIGGPVGTLAITNAGTRIQNRNI